MICPRCKQERELADFARDASKKSGRKSHCKQCDAEKSRAYYVANREKVIARTMARQRELLEAKPERFRRRRFRPVAD